MIKYEIDGNGMFLSESGAAYGSLYELVETEVLGFCGCGMPEEAWSFVYDRLKALQTFTTELESRVNYSDTSCYDRLESNFASDGDFYFFWYWADDKGLIEHGSSVPGWLSDKGKRLLKFMEEQKEMANQMDSPEDSQ